ncbi:hypothetical protein HBA54_02925 [Pelagibius litoralis]|uniref:SPOR domain-containing protein n=1 Tax=Pelagibius litoralis TaxID=374515 RepID=A0A967EX38_9PROT|nr:SPOR domain-containing protein [Pelagibius litoralis]NIA67535.1 hypothetical protein [Pelagibius litoralis]
MAVNAGRDGVDRDPPGSDRSADSPAAAGAPAFSDEGMRRIIYAQDRDRSGAAFGEDTAELESDLEGRRRLVPAVIAVAALVCFGAIVWYAYSWGTGQMAGDQLPLVQADAGPEKSRPEQSGGLDVPHQDKSFLNDGQPASDGPRVESLLPPPETPQPPEPLPEASAPEMAAEQPGSAIPPATAPQTATNQDGETGVAAALPEIPQIPELPVAGDPAASADQAEPAQAETETGIALPQLKPRDRPVQAPPAEDAIAKLLSEEPLETANGNPTAPAGAAKAGDIVLQLSSVKSEAAASKEWARLQADHPGLLGNLALSLDTAEVQGSTFYRVQTGPFASRDAAAKVCGQLKSRNQDCLVKQR